MREDILPSDVFSSQYDFCRSRAALMRVSIVIISDL